MRSTGAPMLVLLAPLGLIRAAEKTRSNGKSAKPVVSWIVSVREAQSRLTGRGRYRVDANA